MELDPIILEVLNYPKYQKIMDDNTARVRKECLELGMDFDAVVAELEQDMKDSKCAH